MDALLYAGASSHELLMHDKRCCKTLVTNRSMQFQEMSRLPKEDENGKKARGRKCKPTHSSFFLPLTKKLALHHAIIRSHSEPLITDATAACT